MTYDEIKKLSEIVGRGTETIGDLEKAIEEARAEKKEIEEKLDDLDTGLDQITGQKDDVLAYLKHIDEKLDDHLKDIYAKEAKG